jgi:hypothetical protein
MTHRRAVLVASLAASLSVIGCTKFQKARFNRGLGVDGDSVLVIPFSEPKNHRWYTESERGVKLAEAFKWWVTDNASPNFPTGSAASDALKAVRDWERDTISVEDWRRLTLGLDVKYVLVGTIENLAITSPRRIGMLDPSVEATYQLINVETGKLAVERPRFTLELEQSKSHHDIPSLELGSDPQDAERRLLLLLAAEIGQDLYGYYPQ